jgi:predicted transcriptional regulator
MTKLVRKNIRMSPEVAKAYEEKAEAMGISQSALMVVALTDYLKQEKTINMMSNIEAMFKQLEKENPQNE